MHRYLYVNRIKSNIDSMVKISADMCSSTTNALYGELFERLFKRLDHKFMVLDNSHPKTDALLRLNYKIVGKLRGKDNMSQFIESLAAHRESDEYAYGWDDWARAKTLELVPDAKHLPDAIIEEAKMALHALLDRVTGERATFVLFENDTPSLERPPRAVDDLIHTMADALNIPVCVLNAPITEKDLTDFEIYATRVMKNKSEGRPLYSDGTMHSNQKRRVIVE